MNTADLNNITRSSFLDVYFAPIIKDLTEKPLFPEERAKEVKNVSNERVKREKYSAWLLLEYALKNSLGRKLEDLGIYKSESGKWRSDKCEFSISHSKNAVAVAVSDSPVGIDIEPFDVSLSPSFSKKILNESEKEDGDFQSEKEKNEFVIRRWCVKEAVFKKNGKGTFSPFKIREDGIRIIEKSFSLCGEEYFCAVTAENDEKVRFFEISDLL